MQEHKIEIKKYLPEHYGKTVEWLNKKEMQKLFGLTYDISLASHTRWVESNPSIEFLPLYCDENYIGNIVLTYAPRHLSAYLQIYIGDERFTGKGLGAKFMVKAHEYIFNEKKYNRIWLHIREHNEIAQKLYLKLGYQKEGFERESILEEGKFYNQVTMSLLAREFSTKK